MTGTPASTAMPCRRKQGGVVLFIALTLLVGVGLNVLIGLTGQVSFGHVGFYAIGAYVVGLAFGFGWTPCIGPILASILMIAATSGHAGRGLLFLSVYSVGLGVPFLISGLLFHQFLSFFRHFRKYIRLTEIVTGVLLILVGLLLISGKLGWLTMQLYRWLPVQG